MHGEGACQIAPIHHTNKHYSRNSQWNYESKSWEGFLKQDYNYVKCAFTWTKTRMHHLNVQSNIGQGELQVPFSLYKSAFVVRQAKSDENYLNPRDLPLLESND